MTTKAHAVEITKEAQAAYQAGQTAPAPSYRQVINLPESLARSVWYRLIEDLHERYAKQRTVRRIPSYDEQMLSTWAIACQMMQDDK